MQATKMSLPLPLSPPTRHQYLLVFLTVGVVLRMQSRLSFQGERISFLKSLKTGGGFLCSMTVMIKVEFLLLSFCQRKDVVGCEIGATEGDNVVEEV